MIDTSWGHLLMLVHRKAYYLIRNIHACNREAVLDTISDTTHGLSD
jgi:hypothetical protein